MNTKVKKILRKILKIILYSILSIIVGIFLFSTIYYLKTKKQYITLLNQHQAYSSKQDTSMPEFMYVEPSHYMLDSLRIKYNLDSVAGNGSETDQIIRLMRWAHYIAPHSTFNAIKPEKRNAFKIIDVDGGVNCRMVGTVLNEAYLSLGFKSRLITCTPHSDDYKENHSLTIVYSNSLQKWLYMDPTWEAYFMDQDSTLLGPLEIRQRMANKEPLFVADNINYNGTKYLTNAGYKWYMSKNLFRFYCTDSSEPGYETKKGIRTFIHLYPEGYHLERIGRTDTTRKVFIDKYTNNKDYFFRKPL